MTAFTSQWLALREPADRRARNRELADALAARFALREDVSVLDLACGAGAALRAIAPLLPAKQHWLLADHDEGLIEAAKVALSSWADHSEETAGQLRLKRDGREIDVEFRRVDLARDASALISEAPHLVTASALFDLVSQTFMRDLVGALAANRCAVYATLTYNGVQRWTPHRPNDNQMTAAFHRHQMRDKGFGLAAGPVASAYFADQLRLHDYIVLEGSSDWQLTSSDRMLIEELARGHALAVAETGSVPDADIARWVGVKRSAAIVGHEDIFAVPI